MKKPWVVWVYSMFVLLGVISSAGRSLSVVADVTIRYVYPVMYYSAILTLSLIIPQLIFIILFFRLSRRCIAWLYLTVGMSIVLDLMAEQYVWAVLVAVFGWAIWDYIKNKKIEGQHLFA